MVFQKILKDHLNGNIKSIRSLSGGDINEVYKIDTLTNKYVVKINSEKDFPEMFTKESSGLKMLTQTGVRTPNVIDYFTEKEHQFLILEYIEEERIQKYFWINLGRNLAKLHQKSNKYFGLENDNYIGSLLQINTPKSTWERFFVENRIIPLMEMAFNDHLLGSNHIKAFEKFFLHINDLIPQERPSLIHGDLWSGNLMCGKEQIPYLIDPAVYYGNRETDIAMTQMFGGFNSEYLISYHEIFPLEKGWKERIPIHNLYPNLVHLNLFGHSYLSGIESVINRF